MGEPVPVPSPQVLVLEGLDDDAVVTRDGDGLKVLLSSYLHFGQHMFLLRLIADALDAGDALVPGLDVGWNIRTGTVVGRTGDLAPGGEGGRLAELMDLPAPTVEQRAEVLELLCR